MKFMIPKVQKKEPCVFRIAALSAGMVLAVIGILMWIKKMRENGCGCFCHDSCDEEDPCCEDCVCDEDGLCEDDENGKMETMMEDLKEKAEEVAATAKKVVKKAADTAKNVFEQ